MSDILTEEFMDKFSPQFCRYVEKEKAGMGTRDDKVWGVIYSMGCGSKTKVRKVFEKVYLQAVKWGIEPSLWEKYQQGKEEDKEWFCDVLIADAFGYGCEVEYHKD